MKYNSRKLQMRLYRIPGRCDINQTAHSNWNAKCELISSRKLICRRAVRWRWCLCNESLMSRRPVDRCTRPCRLGLQRWIITSSCHANRRTLLLCRSVRVQHTWRAVTISSSFCQFVTKLSPRLSSRDHATVLRSFMRLVRRTPDAYRRLY